MKTIDQIVPNIELFSKEPCYACDIAFHRVISSLKEYQEQGLDLDPDFQRPHVWSDEKRSNYIEYVLKGGNDPKAKTLYLNCQNFKRGIRGDFTLVDGKQRIEAIRKFFAGELTVFGEYHYEDLKECFVGHSYTMRILINDFATRSEVLKWYLDINVSGEPHTPEEIERVRKLLKGLET